MFLKLKHQHGDVLVTKTLMLGHLKMATKVQKSMPLAVINSPTANCHLNCTNFLHKSKWHWFLSPQYHEPALDCSLMIRWQSVHALPPLALPLQDPILNPIPRLHLYLRRKVMSMHSLLISNFPSHKKVFFSARIRPTTARIGPIDQYIHKQAAAASSQAREERRSIHLTRIRRCRAIIAACCAEMPSFFTPSAWFWLL